MYAHPSDGQQNDPRYVQGQESGEQARHVGPSNTFQQQAWQPQQQQQHQPQHQHQVQQSQTTNQQQQQQHQQHLWQYQQGPHQQQFFPTVCEGGGTVGQPSIWSFHDLADMPYTAHHPTASFEQSSSSSQPSWPGSGMAFSGQSNPNQRAGPSSASTASDALGHTDSRTGYPGRSPLEVGAPAAPPFRDTIHGPTQFSTGSQTLSETVNSNEGVRQQQQQWLSHDLEGGFNPWPILQPSEVPRHFHGRRPDEEASRQRNFGAGASRGTYNPLLQASGVAYASDSSTDNTTQERANFASRGSHPAASSSYQRGSSSDTQVSSSNQSEESPILLQAGTSTDTGSSTSLSAGKVDVKDQKRAEEVLKRIRTRAPDSKEGVAACDYCRKRKIKCDREKPSCSRCAAAGRVCLTTDTLRKRGPPSKKERELLAAEGIHFVPSRHRRKSDLAGREASGEGARRALTQGLEPPSRSSSSSAGSKRSAMSLRPSPIGRGRAYTAGGPSVQPHDMDPLPLLKGRRLSLSWVDPSIARRTGGNPSSTGSLTAQQSSGSPAEALTRGLHTDIGSSKSGQQIWMSRPNLPPTSASTSSSSSAEQRWSTPGSTEQREGGAGGSAGVQSDFLRPYQPYEEVPSPHSKPQAYYTDSSNMMHPAGGLPGPHGDSSTLAAQRGQEQQHDSWRQAEDLSPRSTGRFAPPQGGQSQYQGYPSQS
ncbi:hypothetical protein BCV69DRAFT_277411 [Microstroma glucosiphilum]|uniref:Zn(2)-C6 fungal-type domain-containing protein n=1 Tax=Pseudomicrostroma glucosiphilum TaxID=1684307 RepID=A0A316U7A4_9BASI|nr:hypothetical protein BCV69DRAFT_277411 [Pseudomicrostroma glucosiphilum]PWN20734.1 hypothetical protein BCV69DRAFT_277411 [Pseudomicrostroma glucosiphilum]